MPRSTATRAFGSAVARRVFLLFLGCALLPVGVLGMFSWVRSSQELERSARESLSRDSKREGLAILSRLLVADALLARWTESDTPQGASRFGFFGRPFRSVAAVRTSDAPGRPLSVPEVAALERGAPVLRGLPGQRVILMRARSDGPRGIVLAAELDPEFLFAYDSYDADSSLTLVDDSATILFSSLPAHEAAALGRAALDANHEGAQGAIDTETEIVEPWVLFVGSHFESSRWHVVRGQSRAATLLPLAHFREIFGWSAALALFVVGAFSSIQIRRSLGPIERLVATAQRLGDGDLGARARIGARDEFGALGGAVDAMAARIERNVASLQSASDLGQSLVGEPRRTRLVSLLLKAVGDAAHARSAAFHTIGAGGALVTDGSFGTWEGLSPAVDEALARRIEVHHVGANSQLVVPILDHHQQPIALLQVSGPQDDGGAPLDAFRPSEIVAVRSLAAQAGIALANRVLVEEFRTLFEGLIELTIKALDAKSSYTAGHCRRVPILAEMLADALCETREGTFGDFRFTPEQRYELRIAALLHDFGKIVTPVHVMDKSTKLETIHDRIELVATRYAVLDREAEIAWLREELAASGVAGREWPGLPELAEELAYLRAHNRGVEALLPEVRERITSIAERRRWRGLDGVSQALLTADEVENLRVERGTLTDAERKVIEEHAHYTIELLAQLPFPPHLRGVPQIAGSHHERVCGGGYPLGLQGDQISLQGRLLGIADVFEALTAPDRPYREPMSVSAAVEQLREMVKRGFLDADVFDVFLREGVHLRYAREQLRPDQLDDATLEALARVPGGPLPLA